MKGSGANQNILYLHKLLAFTNQSSFIASHTFRYPNIKSTPVLDFNWAHKCQESSTGGSAIYTRLSYQQSHHSFSSSLCHLPTSVAVVEFQYDESPGSLVTLNPNPTEAIHHICYQGGWARRLSAMLFNT